MNQLQQPMNRGLSPALMLLRVMPLLMLAQPMQAEDPFRIFEIKTKSRVIQADLADVDADGRGDLVWTSTDDMPPDERRRLHVHFGREPVAFASKPDLSIPIPENVGAYDLADLAGGKGTDVLLLRRREIRVWSFAGRSHVETILPIPGDGSLAAVTDERGLDRLRLARAGLGAPLRLLVPGFAHTQLLEANGAPVAHFDVGGRANYFAPPRPGPVLTESEVEIYFDHPRLSPADVNGDGRIDLVTTNRHSMRVFRQREDGGFDPLPRIALGLLSKEDHTRSSGSVRIVPQDLTGDDRTDLVIMKNSGSIFGGEAEITVHHNRDSAWNLKKPDQTFALEGGVTTNQLIDIDGDGHVDLVTVRVPTGILEVVEILLTKALDAEVAVHRGDGAEGFATIPLHTWKIGVDVSFETFRLAGFVPTLNADLNGDGHRDFLQSGNGKQLEVYLGSAAEGFQTQHASQDLETAGRIRFGDIDGNDLADFAIYDPGRPGSTIRIGHNLGKLPDQLP